MPPKTFLDWRAPLPPRRLAPLDLSAERAALAVEQTKAAKLKNAISAGEFTETSAMVKIVEAMFSVVRENILTLPGKISDSIADFAPTADRATIHKTIYDECRQLLVSLSSKSAMESAARKKMDGAGAGDVVNLVDAGAGPDPTVARSGGGDHGGTLG